MAIEDGCKADVEFAHEVIQIARDDVQQVYLRVTGASAALYFHYLSKVHLARLDMARSIRDGRAAEVEEIWAGTGRVWTRYGWAFAYGGRFLALSIALLGLTLAALLNLVP